MNKDLDADYRRAVDILRMELWRIAFGGNEEFEQYKNLTKQNIWTIIRKIDHLFLAQAIDQIKALKNLLQTNLKDEQATKTNGFYLYEGRKHQLQELYIQYYKIKIDAIETIIGYIDNLIQPEPESAKKPKGSIETPELMAVIEMVKTKPIYNGIKGIQLKMLHLALIESKIIAEKRTGSAFHRLCKEKFRWDVASESAMNSPFNRKKHQVLFDQMLIDIKTAISKM